MAKDHGRSVKDDKEYEGLRKKGMSKSRAAPLSQIRGTPRARAARAAARRAAVRAVDQATAVFARGRPYFLAMIVIPVTTAQPHTPTEIVASAP